LAKAKVAKAKAKAKTTAKMKTQGEVGERDGQDRPSLYGAVFT